MPYGLSDELLKQIVAVIQKHPHVLALLLIGSRAKGNYRPGSDIDLIVKGEDFNLPEMLTLTHELEETCFPYQVHLINHSTVTDPAFLEHIKRWGITIYQAGT